MYERKFPFNIYLLYKIERDRRRVRVARWVLLTVLSEFCALLTHHAGQRAMKAYASLQSVIDRESASC